MRLLIAIFALVGLLGAIQFVQAGRGPSNGIEGTISTLGTDGFAMTTKDGKTIEVLCNANTKFQSGGEAADPKDIKVGTRVGVLGGMTSQTQVTANVVNILPTKGKKKT